MQAHTYAHVHTHTKIQIRFSLFVVRDYLHSKWNWLVYVNYALIFEVIFFFSKVNQWKYWANKTHVVGKMIKNQKGCKGKSGVCAYSSWLCFNGLDFFNLTIVSLSLRGKVNILPYFISLASYPIWYKQYNFRFLSIKIKHFDTLNHQERISSLLYLDRPHWSGIHLKVITT